MEKVTQNTFDQYLQTQYRELAAAAWAGYQKGGRGFVTAQVDNTVATPEGCHPAAVSYGIDRDLEMLARAYKPNSLAEIRELLTVYDPTAEFLILVTFKSDLSEWTARFQVPGETPEELYRKFFAYLDNHALKDTNELGPDFLNRPN